MPIAEQSAKRPASLQVYLEEEAQSTTKHEFWDGEIIAIAGDAPAHNKIANSIGTAIYSALDKNHKDCAVFSSDQQVYIPAFNRCVYPDWYCGMRRRGTFRKNHAAKSAAYN